MKFTDLSSPAYFDNPYPFYEGIRSAGAFVPLARYFQRYFNAGKISPTHAPKPTR
ncbi:MAG: hypothetical protein ACN6QC_16640 [Paraburkholderia hospita]